MAHASPMRVRRITLGLTLMDLAFKARGKTKINTGRLSLIERGLVAPRDDEKRRIAAALETDSAALFPVATSEPTTEPAASA